MDLFVKPTLWQRIFKRRQIRLMRSRQLMVLTLIVLIFLTISTSIVFERYVLHQDNLIAVLPPATGVYAHFNTSKHHHVAEQLRQFVALHPMLHEQWGDEVLAEILSHWPPVEGIAVQEVGYALVPVEHRWEPVLLLFTDAEHIMTQQIVWEAQDWHVTVLDAVVVVSRAPYSLWQPDSITLRDTVHEIGRPTSNVNYVYANLKESPSWLPSISQHPVLSTLTTVLTQEADKKVFSITVRDSLLALSDQTTPLATPQISPAASWVDRVAREEVLVLKHIAIQQLYQVLAGYEDLYPGVIQDVFTVTRFNAKYGIPFETVVTWFEDKATMAFFWDAGRGRFSDVVMSIPISDSFDIREWESLMLQAASFAYPDKVSKQLPDGTYFTELVAQPHNELRIQELSNTNGIGVFGVGAEVDAEQELWDWVYAFHNSELYLANSEPALSTLLSGSGGVVSHSHPCLGISDSYIFIDFPRELAQSIGLDDVTVTMDNDLFTICTQ